MIDKEPVATVAGATLVVAWLIGELLPTMPEEVRFTLAGMIVAAIVWYVRKRTFTENTLREAGLNPADVAKDAKDDTKLRNTEGEA